MPRKKTVPTPTTLGGRIRQARGKQPRRLLAIAIDCDAQSIYRWETDAQVPSVATLRAIAAALSTPEHPVTAGWLLDGGPTQAEMAAWEAARSSD
jgi:transcriptional regulator with XRE-family HTH domain